MRAYPALDGKVVTPKIDDANPHHPTNTVGSGVKDSADMALTQNGADLKTYLLDDGLSYAYFPKALESVVAEQYREPAVVTFVNSLLILQQHRRRQRRPDQRLGADRGQVEGQGLLQKTRPTRPSTSTS